MIENIFQQDFSIDKNARSQLHNHNSVLIWLTGLSGSGKSTIANAVEIELYEKKISTFILDGDNTRLGLNKDLKFSPEDRSENLRRIAEVSKLFLDAGVVVIGSFVSPYSKDRQMVRNIVGTENFLEIFINTPVEECEKRDVKGLYKKARAGEIKGMTGLDAPYELPLEPDLEIKTELMSVEQSAKIIVELIENKIILKK